MWQVLLAAAAAAGSGILAKKLTTNQPSNQNLDEKNPSFNPQDSNICNENEDKTNIFKFASICTNESEMESKNQPLRKKMVGKKMKKKSGSMMVNGNGQEGSSFDQRKIGGKKVSVCLKKRRTSRNGSGKCETCASKESSVFNYGLGVGIMYMMSAGKSKINKLNSTMDETSKIVQELKDEISKKKTLINVQSFSSSGTKTEQPEVMEIDQLEAEFVSELQKIPLCGTQDSSSYSKIDTHEDYNANSYQSGGISPSLLDKKLCHVVIEQQESQINELSSKLQSTNSKLLEKETELQALKDCVRKLTEFSITSVSDEENESQDRRVIDDDKETKKSVVGMKRGMDFKTYGC